MKYYAHGYHLAN